MKAIVYGAGGTAKEFFLRKSMSNCYNIIGVIDSDEKLKGTKFFDYIIAGPDDISKYEYDVIIVCSLCYEEIVKRLKDEFLIPAEKVVTYQSIDKKICDQIIKKYEDNVELDMIDTLNEFRKGTSSILGAYNPPFTIYNEVLRDKDGWPFIFFQDKKMYYPFDYVFLLKNGKEVVPDILYEQGEDSPHLYLPSGYTMPNEAVIVDAGVCEGNFALRFIDTAKRIYLIESDNRWMEALKRTFKPYSNKVVYVNKFLSGRDNSKEITLDRLIEDRLDFLKMDIEGAEVESLLGARRVLTSNNVQCAVCSYHRQYDEKYIQFILQAYGYDTTASKGYIFFPYDENMVDTMDLRKGVVYAKK
ncbi:MAG: FkbM family methyltransferase [Oribacterium sp.]|nr:FkbM family methyltransferase [Oribacterium sp.]